MQIIDTAFLDEKTLRFGTSKGESQLSEDELKETNFLTAVYRKQAFNYPKFFKMDNLSKCGFLCAELMKDSFPDMENRKNVGVVCFNRISSLTTDKNFENTIIEKDSYYPSPALFVYTLPNIQTGEICIRHKFMGESSFYVLEDYDKKTVSGILSGSLQQNEYVLSGWTDLQGANVKCTMKLIKK